MLQVKFSYSSMYAELSLSTICDQASENQSCGHINIFEKYLFKISNPSKKHSKVIATSKQSYKYLLIISALWICWFFRVFFRHAWHKISWVLHIRGGWVGVGMGGRLSPLRLSFRHNGTSCCAKKAVNGFQTEPHYKAKQAVWLQSWKTGSSFTP